MKWLLSIMLLLIIAIGLSACSHNEKNASTVSSPMKKTPDSENANDVVVNGIVKHLIINPSGKVDGFILNDGTQISSPPYLSAQIIKTASINERVNVIGTRENNRLITAIRIMNVYTNEVVLVGPPARALANIKSHKTGMQQLQAKGKIQSHIFGKEGEVKGVILSDKSIVSFGPKVSNKSKVKYAVGQGIKVSGHGTKNSYGKSLEATTISTY